MKSILLALMAVPIANALGGCVTVKPQEHATLADPTMVFDDDARQRAQMDHALDNREAAYGGNGVAGGGCGCN
ncbi:MAG: DUF4266 domain-containing protein [Polyangiaceae bacterium]|jgi:hypothetical protein